MNRADVDHSLQNIKNAFNLFIVESNIVSVAGSVGWPNYQSGFSKSCYPREYQKLIDDRQYSFLLHDKSFFQFYYLFDQTGVLAKAKLAYYPRPEIFNETAEELLDYADRASMDLEDLFLDLSELAGEGIQLNRNSHIRLDFDSSCVSHSSAHVQFGGLNDLRISSSKVILPFAFMNFIYKSLFQLELAKVSSNSTYRAGLSHSLRRSQHVDDKEEIFLTT